MLRGDASGAVIHPFFIHSTQTLGMYFCEGMDDSSAMNRLHAKHAHMCTESLMDILEKRDWELMAQTAVWVMAGYIILQLSETVHLYIRKCCEAVNTGGLQFIPTYGKPPGLSGELHEKLLVLSQLIYFENFLFLTCGGAEPRISARIEKEFRHKLQVRPATSLLLPRCYLGNLPLQQVYPVLFKICPLTMRTQTILLVRDTILILNLRPTDGRYRFCPLLPHQPLTTFRGW